MIFNTAIFYDIENLIGGYGKADLLASLSLKDIFHEFSNEHISGIALQRAYANWNDARLGILKGDIIELGIEPIQMFGFGKGTNKNASDIQLAIDAVDICHTKPQINVFIIVSGDGGFSYLAKKLHENNKMVIGCAYKRVTNKVFQAVCDDFIWIDEPEDEPVTHNPIKEQYNNPIVLSFAKIFKPIDTGDEDIINNGILEVFNFLKTDKVSKDIMSSSGLNLSIISELLEYKLNKPDYLKFGFVKLVDFLRFYTRKANLKLVFNPPSEYRITFDHLTLKQFEDVSPITVRPELHSLETYKLILQRGLPSFRLLKKQPLHEISAYMAENKITFTDLNLGDVVNLLTSQLIYEQAEIKQGVFTLIAAKCFYQEPEDAKISDQKLSFIPKSADDTFNFLDKAIKQKLTATLGSYKNELLEDLFN